MSSNTDILECRTVAMTACENGYDFSGIRRALVQERDADLVGIFKAMKLRFG